MKPQRLIFFSSGEGQLFENTAKKLLGEGFQVAGLVTQNPQAGCVKRAGLLSIPVYELSSDKTQLAISLRQILESLKPDYIILAGFTRKIPADVVEAYAGRILNSHPSLLPQYGGKGMYGSFVHQAVVAAGEKQTGISVHVVTADYDDGPIIAQKQIPLLPGETAESLESRLKEIEREFFGVALVTFLKSRA